jgi:hypothetical protein
MRSGFTIPSLPAACRSPDPVEEPLGFPEHATEGFARFAADDFGWRHPVHAPVAWQSRRLKDAAPLAEYGFAHDASPVAIIPHGAARSVVRSAHGARPARDAPSGSSASISAVVERSWT